MKNLFYSFSLILLFLVGCKTEEPQVVAKLKSINFDSTLFHITDEDTLLLNIKFNPMTLKQAKYTIYSDSNKIAKMENGKLIGVDQGTAKIIVYVDSIPSLRDSCFVSVKRKSGTAENPILIYTLQDIKKYRDLINNQNIKYGNRYYKLMNDLDFSNEDDWIPIGGIYPDCLPFTGKFDGNDKVVKNLKITKTYPGFNYYCGFFGYIWNGEVKNLGIKWNSLNTNYSNGGGIAGFINNSIIVNCFTSGNIVCNEQYYGSNVGGIVGFIITDAHIINCYSNANIKSNGTSGGIIGTGGGLYNVGNTSSCINCYSNGTIISNDINDAKSGGITGGDIYGNISHCIALNDSVTCITNEANRITSNIDTYSQNYADSTMIVLVGNSRVTDFTSTMKHGINLTNNYINLLNDFVESNPTFSGITLKHWTIKVGSNNGYPVFE